MNIDQRLNLGDRKNDFLLAAAMICSSLFFLNQAWKISGKSGLLPVAICGVMLLAGLGLLGQGFYRRARAASAATGTGIGIDFSALTPVMLIMLVLLVAVLVTPYLGYFSGATVLLLVIPALLKYYRWKKVLVITVLFQIGVFLVFVEGFGKRLPSGLLF